MVSEALFQEILTKGIVMFERRRPQIANAPTPRFQANRDNLTLNESLQYVLNEHLIEEDRTALLGHLAREAKAILRKKAMDERINAGPPQASFTFMGRPHETWRPTKRRMYAPRPKGMAVWQTRSQP